MTGHSLRHNLERRARVLKSIRAFFHARGVLEVTTPVLGRTAVPDVHLASMTVQPGGGWEGYLQTSPEYFMKRLLALGSGDIFEITSCFRAGEAGELHNPEFTMLEWYRVEMPLEDLLQEVEALIQMLCDKPVPKAQVCSYRQLFEATYGVNPHELTPDSAAVLVQEKAIAHDHIDPLGDATTLSDYLDLLFEQGVQPALLMPTMVFGFPACQSALARLIQSPEGDLVAARAEYYWKGVELANGYDELNEPVELRERFGASNLARARRGMPQMALDEPLLQASSSLPVCSGVALGLERLMMLIWEEPTIENVMSFPFARL
ncbi:MAG: EF-P lysine aminoacylase GenX [Pseudomonadales bacterium]|nr:EF-P lysine aminoacylase GenX [Pseudomonadales bacterium]